MSRFNLKSYDFSSFFSKKIHMLILFGILILTILVRWALPYFFKPDINKLQQAKLQKKWQKFVAANKQEGKEKATMDSLFYFNPNTIDKSGLIALGLPMKTVYTWLHFRKAGGHFYKKEDLKTLYTLTDKGFQRLKPYISLTENTDSKSPYQKAGNKPSTLFTFNPNKISKADLIKLGLPMQTVYTWLNYRKAGGHFYKKEDLKKLYTLSSREYNRLAPFVNLPEEKGIEKTKVSKKQIPLNRATAKELKRLPGIGKVLSHRIIHFREALGGFYSVSQLKEVYGLPDSTYQKVSETLTVDPSLINRININTATQAELHAQPYLRPFVKQILKLRKKLNHFNNLKQIRQIELINSSKYRKIAPYLTI